jgi:hypothetical protein
MSTEVRQKRNSGRTGPVTPEGCAISSQNSRKHGLCSQALIQPGETMHEFLFLLKHWCRNYRCAEGHVLFEAVRQTAKAEWFRIRAQRQYNACLAGAPDPQSKTRALLLRYKTAAEHAFQRAFRLLHQQLTAKPPHLPTAGAPESHPASASGPTPKTPISPFPSTTCTPSPPISLA